MTKARVTKIKVRGEMWSVPRGFGRVYRDTALDYTALPADRQISEVIDLLALVGYHVIEAQVSEWNLRKRCEAVIYAATEHARASDNPVQRHPRPSWLPRDPWQGPPRGEGVFLGPSGTPVETSP